MMQSPQPGCTPREQEHSCRPTTTQTGGRYVDPGEDYRMNKYRIKNSLCKINCSYVYRMYILRGDELVKLAAEWGHFTRAILIRKKYGFSHIGLWNTYRMKDISEARVWRVNHNKYIVEMKKYASYKVPYTFSIEVGWLCTSTTSYCSIYLKERSLVTNCPISHKPNLESPVAFRDGSIHNNGMSCIRGGEQKAYGRVVKERCIYMVNWRRVKYL